jgi:hypothetical protein
MKTITLSTAALLMFLLATILTTCNKEDLPSSGITDKMLKIKIRFDSDQARLDSFGNPAVVPSTHATQTPSFNTMSAHFIELVGDEFTPYQQGAFLYKGEEVPANNPNTYGFTTAIDFDNALVTAEEEVFLEIPLSAIDTGVYHHIRVSVAYQNYEVLYNLNNVPVINSLPQQSGTIASFVGYNTYVNNLRVDELEVAVNAPKLQGFWGFETKLSEPYSSYNQISTGQAPADATTVVNPFANAPIPRGSCVVAGSFDIPLTVSWDETEDVYMTLSFSTNGSFEWEDTNGNDQWDIDATNTNQSERVVDMGLRGLSAFWE